MNKFKYLFLFASAVGLMATACTNDNTENEPIYKGKTTTLYVSSDAGNYDFAIKTDGRWSAAPVNSASKQWLDIRNQNDGKGNGTLSVYYRANNTFSREGRIVVNIEGARLADTIVIRQYGVTPVLEFREPENRVFPVGGKAEFKIHTNLTGSFLERIEVLFSGGSGSNNEWITERSITDDGTTVLCTIDKNTETDRTGNLQLSYVDDWGIRHQTSCRIDQVSMGVTEPLTFAQARALATESEVAIDKNYIIEGIVVSDRSSANVAGNPNTSQTQIDYTKNDRTFYLQSTDGAYGFAVECEKAADNIFDRYDRVTLSLNGAMLSKKTSPERYVLTNVSPNALFGHESGSVADLPKKEKYISELTPEDIYTYVTLKECEFPTRKGSYVPINEGYAYMYNVYRLDKYPLTARDSKGGHIFVLTNCKAPWRRDGNALPQGAGKLSGVIVNEDYMRFEKDGNIGDFQIRPIDQADIALAKEASKAYSKVIAAWGDKPTITAGKAMSTVGTGELSHTSTTAITTANDFSRLGPIDGVTDGKGASSSTGWKNTVWWDSTNNCGESWVIKFSTAGISAKHIAVTFAVMNQTIGAPRYWAVEWSEHGQKLGSWNRVAEYTVPDVVQWGNTLYNHTAGHKNISLELPVEILGKQTVYVRLIPTSTKAGTTTTYDTGTYSTTKESHMSYLSIIYND